MGQTAGMTTARWQIGDIDIVRVTDDDFALPSDRPVPEWCVGDLAPSLDEVGLAFSALAVRSADTNIVIDPWLANDFPRNGDDAAARAERLLGELTAEGFPADAVDIVVNTHLDGIGWNTRPDGDGGWCLSFPSARHLYPAAEVEAIERGDDIGGRDAFVGLAALVDIERVRAPEVIAPGVALVDAPGHNPGHHAVRIVTDDDIAIYPGHLILTPFDIADPDEDQTVGMDGEPAALTRRVILDELADRGGLLLTTLLGGSGGGRVVRDGAGFALTR